MTFKIYLGCDFSGIPEDFHKSHEAEAVRNISRHLMEKYRGTKSLEVALVANPRIISPDQKTEIDLVLITNGGIGFVELKGWPGQVFNKGYKRAQGQVKKHAESAIKGLLKPEANWLPNITPWLQGGTEGDDDPGMMEFSTAVCFTDPRADITALNRATVEYERDNYKEKSSIITPAEIVDWTFDLRFGVHKDGNRDLGPYNIVLDEIVNLAENYFKAQPWELLEEVIKERREPFGFILLLETGQPLPIDHEEALLGRSRTTNIMLPKKYALVSGQHVRVIHVEDEVLIENLGKHNTFLNNQPISGIEKIKSGDTFWLGPPDRPESCQVKYLDYETYQTVSTKRTKSMY